MSYCIIIDTRSYKTYVVWKYNTHRSTIGILYTIYVLNLAIIDGCKQETYIIKL